MTCLKPGTVSVKIYGNAKCNFLGTVNCKVVTVYDNIECLSNQFFRNLWASLTVLVNGAQRLLKEVTS